MKREIDHELLIPLYQQLVDIILQDIEKGTLKSGDRIPPETKLMEMYSVSRVTVRSALSRLVDSGHLIRIQGKGTFLSSSARPSVPLRTTNSFSSICRSQNLVPGAKVISLRYETASDDTALFFSLPLGSQIIVLRRLRLADGIPVLIEKNEFSPSMSFLFQENMEQALYDVLQKYGYQPAKSYAMVGIHSANEEEASLLHVNLGHAMIQNFGKIYDIHSKPLHTSSQLVRTDKDTVFKYYV